jgi:hypothetical protein
MSLMANVNVDASQVTAMAREMDIARVQLRSATVRNFLARLYVMRQNTEDVYKQAGITPVASGALRDSTAVTVRSEGELSATIEVRQPATNAQGQQYAIYVIMGHRIVAWGHDTGRMQPPNDYPARADAILRPAMERHMKAVGHDAMIETVVAMRGVPL